MTTPGGAGPPGAGQPSIGSLGPSLSFCCTAADDEELELLELQLSATAKRLAGTGRVFQYECGDECEEVAKLRSAGHFSRFFATHPRKRHKQKSLMTLWSDRQLLEEVQPEQTRRLLSNVLNWNFNAFTLDRLSSGRNLTTLCTYLFATNDLIRTFNLDYLTVFKFFAMVERGYHSTNPYHNSVHAADVTQAMACFLAEPLIKKHLTPLEVMASLVAAVCHDVDHPGFNEKFLIASSSHLAGLYHNASVLENHHWRTAISMMRESGLADLLTTTDLAEMQEIIKNQILATDISRQSEFLALLKRYQETGELDMSQKKYRHFVLQIAVKCADISNPCRAWNISRLWSYRACEEFFRQGDRERVLGFQPVTSFCDRNNITVAKVQSGFYRYMATPLFEEWNRFIASPLSNSMINILYTNLARWELIMSQERSGAMAESVASHASSSSSSSSSSASGAAAVASAAQASGLAVSSSSRRESLEPGHASHSDDSDPCVSYPYMPLDQVSGVRRHSLPHSPALAQTARRLENGGGGVLRMQRRSSFQPTSAAAAAQRRRVFAQNHRLVISAVESLSSDGEDRSPSSNEDVKQQLAPVPQQQQLQQPPRVTFHLARTSESGSETSKDEFDPTSDADSFSRQVAKMHCPPPPPPPPPPPSKVGNSHDPLAAMTADRRGSAPCDLLMNQINKIAATAAVVAVAAAAASSSRDNSPEPTLNRLSRRIVDEETRRRSLPATTAAAAGDLKRNNSLVKASLARSMDRTGGLRPPSLCHNGSNLRASSFGGVGSTGQVAAAAAADPDTILLRRGSAPGCANAAGAGATSIDLVNLIQRASLPHNNSRNRSLEQALASQLSKVHLLRQSLALSPSVEAEIIDRVVSSCIASQGMTPPSTAALQSALNRRGSLPTDLNQLPRFTPVEPSS